LVMVVDGLDSCEQDQVLYVLDAVHLLFTEQSTPFITLLAIDPHIIIKVRWLNSCTYLYQHYFSFTARAPRELVTYPLILYFEFSFSFVILLPTFIFVHRQFFSTKVGLHVRNVKLGFFAKTNSLVFDLSLLVFYLFSC
jgi:hypothetical protein